MALGLVVAGVMALSASASASSIVYVCADGANLCRVDPGTGAQTQLTTDGQSGTSNVYGGPSLSRDGTKLAFVFDYHVIVGDGNAGSRGTPFATTALVALMRPDGGQVAELEQTFAFPAIQVCTYGLDGSVRHCPYGTPSAGWAPDNNLLISVSAGAPNNNLEICHVSAASNQACSDVRAADSSNDLYDPAVSPDGSTLAVEVANGIGGSPSGHLALYNYATGQFERNLTSGTGDELPSWSPDGTQIAFQRGNGIYVIGVNDPPGSERQLVQGSQPTWGGSTSAGGTGGTSGTGGTGGTSGTGGTGEAAPNSKLAARTIDRRHHRATFRFKALGIAEGFQCALVKLQKHHKAPKPRYSRCRSPKTYKGLPSATYKFYVRAFNTKGRDPTPATAMFKL
jgi:hypothetical protein